MFANGRNATALSHADQSCEKATKVCMAMLGIIGKKDHIISRHVRDDVIPSTSMLKDRFKSHLKFLTDIETYYFPSRYGVDLYGRISFDHYERSNVERLLHASKEYVELCFQFIEEKAGKSIPRTAEGLTDYFKANYSGFITK
jgi:HEPN domain-containing protein